MALSSFALVWLSMADAWETTISLDSMSWLRSALAAFRFASARDTWALASLFSSSSMISSFFTLAPSLLNIFAIRPVYWEDNFELALALTVPVVVAVTVDSTSPFLTLKTETSTGFSLNMKYPMANMEITAIKAKRSFLFPDIIPPVTMKISPFPPGMGEGGMGLEFKIFIGAAGVEDPTCRFREDSRWEV